MKLVTAALTLALLTGSLWAQAAPAAPAPPAPPAAPRSHHDMVNPDMVDKRMQQAHAQEMQAEVAKMRAKVDLMKANLATMTAGAAKDQAQLDTDLWDGMVTHLESMAKMMSDHGAMGMGMMHEGGMHHEGMSHDDGMSCCAGMKKDGEGCCGGNKCMKDDKPAAPAEKP